MIHKKLKLDVEHCTLMHLLKVNLYEKVSIKQTVRQAILPKSTLRPVTKRSSFDLILFQTAVNTVGNASDTSAFTTQNAIKIIAKWGLSPQKKPDVGLRFIF